MDQSAREDLLQCLWCRAVVALVGCLTTFASSPEVASIIVQAARASGTSIFLTLPRKHDWWASEAFTSTVQDSGLNLCPCPDEEDIFFASCALPTWPLQDDHLTALEIAGRLSCLSTNGSPDRCKSLASLLNRTRPFVAHRPPICDGAGNVSSADHSVPTSSGLSEAAAALLHWATDHDLPKRVFGHVSQSLPGHPLSEDEQQHALQILCRALNLSLSDTQPISQGQPFRLGLMSALASATNDPDCSLPSMLEEGVHTGVFEPIEPSGLWPPAKLMPLSQSGLEICQGNWKPAEADPDTVAALLAEEASAGFIEKVEGGLPEAKRRWPKGIAVGKLSLVKADNRDPRLVLDSTICQVNPLCRVPEAVSMPTVQDVRRSFQPQDPRGVYVAASIDFKAAHKRVKVHSADQGLLLFMFQGVLWRYVVCHFGAKFSAYWWQRVGGLITRLVHHMLASQPHRAWLYVDDLLAALLRASAPDALFLLVALLSCLGAPISWKKACIGDSLIWCGWKFNFAYETVELCEAKRTKLTLQIQVLLSKPKVPRKNLEACIGLLMWATNISQVLRAYVAPLYSLLHSPPGSNYSIAPRLPECGQHFCTA